MLGLGLLTFVLAAFGANQVDSFLDTRTLMVRLDPDHHFAVGDRVVVISQTQNDLAAIGVVASVNAEHIPPLAAVTVREVIGDRLVVPGDAVEALTPDVLRRHHLAGHISLMLGEDDQIPAKFKELPYLGVFNSDGHTLAKGEWLVSAPQLQYGVAEGLTLKVLSGLYLDGFANLGGKVRLMNNEWGKLTLNGLVSRQVNKADWAVLSGMVLTLPSNEKFQSHLVVNVRVEGIEENNPEVDKLNLFPASDVRTIYEYVTDDWNRLLFGPLFNFETQTVGGTLSHMWIWDSFHLNLGVGTSDVSEVEFKRGGYYLVFDFFWRF